MPIPSFSIALKILNKMRSENYKLPMGTLPFLPVDDIFDEFIKDLNLSAAENASCEHERLAHALNILSSDGVYHEDPNFKDVYCLLRIILIIQCSGVDEEADKKIRNFLKLFNTGSSAEQFIICFHDNPGATLKTALPLGTDTLQAVAQLNLISPHINFDILVEQFMQAAGTAAVTTPNFVLGGVNSTAAIKQLKGFTSGDKFLDIATLESRMRPAPNREDKGWSVVGFIGVTESLIDVLASDNEYVVDTLNLTHQMLAAPLKAIMYALINNHSLPPAGPGNPLRFVLHGVNFEVSYLGTHGQQDSPFEDGLCGNKDFTIKNLDNGTTLDFGDLVPALIDRYGFYEGNTPYRIDPRVILKLFDCLFPDQQLRAAPQATLRMF